MTKSKQKTFSQFGEKTKRDIVPEILFEKMEYTPERTAGHDQPAQSRCVLRLDVSRHRSEIGCASHHESDRGQVAEHTEQNR